MRYVFLLSFITISIISSFFLNNIYAETTGYEIEREYWKNRKDLSRKERLKKMDEAYTKRYGDSDSGSVVCCCAAVIIFIGVAAFLSAKDQQKINELLAIAKKNGFVIEKENKICPKCAESIKLQANKCKNCGKTFTGKANQDALKKILEKYAKK